LWGIYIGIRQRCSDKAGKNAKWYSGISCEWASFEDFYRDMGKSYNEHVLQYGEKDTTIERINSDKNYCLQNCRWATNAEQGRNTSQNRWLTYQGRTQCLTDWAKEVGLKKLTLHMRLYYGWTIEKALTTPVQGGPR
jgi:hypothetical protein